MTKEIMALADDYREVPAYRNTETAVARAALNEALTAQADRVNELEAEVSALVAFNATANEALRVAQSEVERLNLGWQAANALTLSNAMQRDALQSKLDAPYSGAGENPPVFGRRWKLARDGFGLQRDDLEGNYVHIDDALSVLHESAAQPAPRMLSDAEMLACLISVDTETKRLPPGLRDFARAILAAAGAREAK